MMDAAKFLDLYEAAVNKAIESPVNVISEIATHLADLHCVGRMREALASSSAEGKDSERLDWQPITAPGQVKVGDKLRFTIGDTHYDEIVKVVLHPRTEREEMIYNKRKNYYVITKNILTGFGNVKDLTFLRVCTGKDTDKEAAK